MNRKQDKEDLPPAEQLSPRQDACLKVAKEVVLKFIEVRSLSLANFGEAFHSVYCSVKKTVDHN